MVDSSRTKNGPVPRSHSPSRTFYSPSPTRVNLYASSNSSISFSIDRPSSPSRSISATSRNQVLKKPSHNQLRNQKRTCMCSPTNHPGSFRCSLHKNLSNQTASYPANRLNARRSAMTNSLVRIGTVEGDLMKRALSALIRPSSHHQKRLGSFESRPSRLSIMSKADD
ncbi:Protein lingerer like [Heracleum sosnowskyi]|uniref:Protein lingerer like n=1 Tax=Heracleum sosnowskyi TaxID=360622 RepID=A0AAD8ISU4_9APIA|nr:Protein lingerer like [Heracleum sosnowskyi]